MSQIITAFRQEDQVIIVMPFHMSDDFRVGHDVSVFELPSLISIALLPSHGCSAHALVHRFSATRPFRHS